MKRFAFVAILLAATVLNAQSKLSPKWEELTSADFVQALAQSKSTCVLPVGILEKHGPHLPLGNDLINVRAAVFAAMPKEYAVVFPEYYAAQIFEARHQPGTIAYSLNTQLTLLQETTDEMARNGCKKILIVNGHGGNESLLPLFAQSQLARRHDYVVFVLPLPNEGVPGRPPMKSKAIDYHAGEAETSMTLATRPDLVHMDRVGQESGADKGALPLPSAVYTGIWWYTRFPNHFSGDPAAANKELGQFDLNTWASQIAEAIKAIKADDRALQMQKEFYDRADNPLAK